MNYDTGKSMPTLEQVSKKEEKFYERFGFKSAAEWAYKNTLGSKMFWGVGFIIVSPLTGVLAPGVLAAGQLLALIGAGDKALKNKAEIAAIVGGLISGLIKKSDKKKGE